MNFFICVDLIYINLKKLQFNIFKFKNKNIFLEYLIFYIHKNNYLKIFDFCKIKSISFKN